MREENTDLKKKVNSARSAEASIEEVTDFAGSVSDFDFSDPHSPLLNDAAANWVADTGATRHMTPHHHWFVSYAPFVTPIRLADNTVIHSTGVGTVRFQPLINGKPQHLLEFQDVLHVPDLRSNLLSVLYLVKNHKFIVHIYSDRMDFEREGTVRFTAPIDASNTAYLAGQVVPALESAQLSSQSTLPLDASLWHRRFAHFHYAGVQKIIADKLVEGLRLESHSSPHPICEPCLAGKLNAAPFPKSLTVTSHLLQLVHSDVHGALPVGTPPGMHLWNALLGHLHR